MARWRRHSALDLLERGALLLFLLALVLFFSIDPATSKVFTSSANVHNILANQSVTGLIALAMVIPLVAGYFDLSVASIAGLSNIAMAAAISSHGSSVATALVVAVVIGVIAGAVNGFLVAGLKLDSLVVTLGTYTLIGGILQLYTKGSVIVEGLPPSLGHWSAADWFGLPRPFWLLIGMAIVCWYFLMKTPAGRMLEGIGSNSAAARLVGIRVDWLVFACFVASGAIAGVAGALLTSSSGSGNPTAGPAYLFPAIAAVFIGSTAIRPGRYNVWGTVIGVFLVAVAVDGFTLLGAESWVSQVFDGGALVIAVAVSSFMRRRREAGALSISAAGDGPGDTGIRAASNSETGITGAHTPGAA
jgi:ribose transport system permease protein